MGDGNYKWWTADSEEAEYYQGPYESRDEAISAGRNGFDGSFYIEECDKSVMSSYIDGDAYAEQIMEDLCERNGDCFGEDGPDDPWSQYENAYRALANAITATVEDWALTYPGKTWTFGNQRNGETIAIPERAAA